jgi:plasmid stabilization system protein ParE
VSLPVTTTPEADAQIRTIDDWWRKNRPASPNLFFDELSSAFDLIAHAPNIGRLYRRSPIVGTRPSSCAAAAIMSTTFRASAR